MVLVLACAAAAGLLLRKFIGFRSAQPERAESVSNNIQGAATMIGAVAQVVSILLKALWGTPVASTTQVGSSRIGELVGEAA